MKILSISLLTILFLAATAQAQVTVSWSWRSEIQESGFELERSPSGCTQWELIARPGVNVMSIDDIDVPGNCYRVRAFDAVKFYPYSNIGTVPPVQDTTPPTVQIASPQNNTTVPRGPRSTVTIQANIGNDAVSTRFLVNNSALSCAALARSCSWNVPAANNRTYTIRVEARDQAGNVGAAQVNVRAQ
jgi:hypothetical protein